MDEQDFDKLYSSKLPDFTSSDWRAMEGALDRHELKRKLTRLMWALPVLGGLLLGVSAIVFYQLKQTQNHVKNLESQLVNAYEKKPPKVENVPPPIIVHDTIYKHIYVRQIVRENYPSNTNNLANNLNNIYYEKYDKTNTENQTILEREKFIGLNELEGKGVVSTNKMSSPRDFSTYKGETFPEDSLIEQNHFSLIPKSVTLSALAGIHQSQGDEDEKGKGFNFGFRTVLGYHNSKGQERWGIVLDIQQQNNFLLGYNKKDKFGRFGPPPNPRPNTGQNPALRKLEIPRFSFVQIGAGLRYNLLFSEKIKPYFGLNWSFQIPTRYDIEYSYEDPNINMETIAKSQEMLQLLGGNVGLNVQLSKRFALGGEVFYQAPISKINLTQDVIPHALGGRVGVSYRIF
jgi:hypothetical protein